MWRLERLGPRVEPYLGLKDDEISNVITFTPGRDHDHHRSRPRPSSFFLFSSSNSAKLAPFFLLSLFRPTDRVPSSRSNQDSFLPRHSVYYICVALALWECVGISWTPEVCLTWPNNKGNSLHLSLFFTRFNNYNSNISNCSYSKWERSVYIWKKTRMKEKKRNIKTVLSSGLRACVCMWASVLL